MTEYRTLKEPQIRRELFSHFIRRQEVTGCWRKKDGVWQIQDDPFIDDWSEADTRAGIIGVEYAPIRQLKIAPNVQWQNPRAGKAVTFLYLNVEFRL